MSEIKFNIRSLSDPGLVRRKSNNLDSKHKEKPYEKKKKRKRNKQSLSIQNEIETQEKENKDSKEDIKKSHHVDVFI